MPRWVPALALAPLLLSCGGGGSPAAPAPVAATPAPTPTPVASPVARDGLTHELVEAEITPPAPGLRETVSVRAPLCLLREQPYDGGPIYLWKVEEDYVDALVYPLTFTDGSFRMIRWAGPFTVTLDQGLDANDTVMRKTQEVMAEVTRWTGLPISIGPNGAVHVTIDANILPDDGAVGEALRSYRGSTIVGATVKLVSVQELLGTNRADYTNTLLHEMGHVMGLGHSPIARDIMAAGGGPATTRGEFQPREALALHMMYQHRTAGNRPPDRDAALFATSAAVPISTVIRD